MVVSEASWWGTGWRGYPGQRGPRVGVRQEVVVPTGEHAFADSCPVLSPCAFLLSRAGGVGGSWHARGLGPGAGRISPPAVQTGWVQAREAQAARQSHDSQLCSALAAGITSAVDSRWSHFSTSELQEAGWRRDGKSVSDSLSQTVRRQLSTGFSPHQ